MKTPILGSSYVARSVNAADSRMVNLFPEIVPEGGKEAAFLSRTPGLKYIANYGSDPVRGMRTVGDYLYVVSGSDLRQVSANYSSVFRGTISNLSGEPVVMSDNGTQLFIVSDTLGYIFDVTTNVLTQITDIDFPGAITVDYLDGFFAINQPDSQYIWVSGLLNGLTWSATAKQAATSSPDNNVGLIVNHNELWIFGETSTEVWYNAGNSPFPFAPISGAVNDIGCASPYTIQKLDNSIFWLGQDTLGHGIVYKANGYRAERVSTHAIEWQIQQLTDISGAFAYTYQQDGHAFYVLTIPGQNTTWVYDVATQAWHERCGFVDGNFTCHPSTCQAIFNNINIIGDTAGSIYQFSLTQYFDDLGGVGDQANQKWLRSWRALGTGQNNLNRSAHHSLQLDCESGVGLTTGQGSDPQVMLRWSDDGGHTWSNERWASMGAIGTYGTRVIWRRLGMTLKLRDRVYEVSGTDPVKVIIMGAELIASTTNA